MPVTVQRQARTPGRVTVQSQSQAAFAAARDKGTNTLRKFTQGLAKRQHSLSTKENFISRPQVAAKNGKLADGVPGFQTSFDASGKGGGAFRSISENFAVNPANGTLSLALPVSSSPTRGAFGPNLSLSYSSGSGNGPLGFGWGIDLAFISCKTSGGIPKYTDDDAFVLSGQDIVPVLDELGKVQVRTDGDYVVTRFRLRVDSQSIRIEKWYSSGSGVVHWRTISADNVTSIFGESSNSCIADSSGSSPKIFSWLLSRTYDARGNAVELNYKAENDHGLSDESGVLPIWEQYRSEASRSRHRYLKRVKYGNRISNRDSTSWEPTTWPSDWMFEVVFDYGDHNMNVPATKDLDKWPLRQDPFSDCHAGFEVRQYRLLRRILMFHHFPGRLNLSENLVSAQILHYDESPQRTLLVSMNQIGYALTDGSRATGIPQYKTEELPAWKFGYTTGPNVEELQSLRADTVTLVNPPSDSKVSEWLDLDSAGIPGLLNTLPDGTMTYQPRTYNGFSAPRTLSQQPSLGRTGKTTFQDLDGSGNLDLIYVQDSQAVRGFYERDDSDSWSTFSDFPDTPTGETQHDCSYSIDLTGDGIADMLVELTDSHELMWKQNLGRKGYTLSLPTSSSDQLLKPRVALSLEARTYIADFTGDGLSDLIEISNGQIIYWQNQGHGAFGGAVVMGNSPNFSQYGEFDHDRLRLIDVDGTGTTDLLYILPTGGAMLFYNLAGNSWGNAIHIPMLPTIADLDSVFVLDIEGRGTASLCWPDTSASSSLNEIRYMNLMGKIKPFLLESYSNGLGHSTSVTYRPSTAFYLEDIAAGRPWTTKLPFPVQLVSTTEMKDEISGNSRLCKYVYHNGCYDHYDSQFAGFEMVEQVERQMLNVGNGETYETPACLVKSWFNVGLSISVDESLFYGPSLVTSKCFKMEELDTCNPFVGLRGSKTRVETFDLSQSQESGIPLAVEEFSYDVRQIQKKGRNAYPVFQISPRASMINQFEGSRADVKRSHDIVLQTNIYGSIQKTLSIVYPREQEFVKKIKYDDVSTNQSLGNVSHTQFWFTNEVMEDQYFRNPVPWRSQINNLIGVPLDKIIDVEEARKMDVSTYPESKSTGPWKILESEERALYLRGDFSDTLPPGKIEAYSILDQSFALAYTEKAVQKIEEGLQKCNTRLKPLPILHDGSYLPATTENVSVADYLESQGYVKMADETGVSYWVPSSKSLFSLSATGVEHLHEARKSFFVPTIHEDARKNRSHVKLDTEYLLVEAVTDACDNTLSFENDYEHLCPFKITDINSNRHQVVLDTLGRVIATANLGKKDQSAGVDRLDGLPMEISEADIKNILVTLQDTTVRRLLGDAGSRIIHLPNQLTSWNWGAAAEVKTQPACYIEITRDQSYQDEGETTVRIKVVYLNGLGQVCQQFALDDSTNSTQAWVKAGSKITDMHGKEFRAYDPTFAASPIFILPSLIIGNAETTFGDAVGREITVLMPDHLWSKCKIDAWSTTEYAAGDMLKQNPLEDETLGPFFSKLKSSWFTPSWLDAQRQGTREQQEAAAKSQAYGDSPTTTYFGSCGLPLRQVRDCGGTLVSRAFSYDVAGNKIGEFDSTNRLVERNRYDLLKRPYLKSGIDSGESWTLYDVDGVTLVSWNSRGICFHYSYDAMHRQTEKWQYSSAESPKLVVKSEYGDELEEASTWNLQGQLWKVFDQSGVHETHEINHRGQICEVSFRPAQNYKTTLDWQSGNTLEETALVHKVKYDYFGQNVQETSPFGAGHSTHRKFSRLGHLKYVGFRTSPASEWSGYLTDSTYTADGLPLLLEYGNGTRTEMFYDMVTRLPSSERTALKRGNRTFVIENFKYFYDCYDRQALVRDESEQIKFFRGDAIKAEWKYTYDMQGQIISASGRGQLPAQGGGDVQLRQHTAMQGTSTNRSSINGNQMYHYLESYKYDLAGNITRMTHEAPMDKKVQGWTREYFYEEPSLLGTDQKSLGNRLSKTVVGSSEELYAYGVNEAHEDDNNAGKVGCMTTLPQFSKIRWNSDNMMASSSTQHLSSGVPETTHYVYDYTGTRVRKVTESSASEGQSPRKIRDTKFIHGGEIRDRISTNNGVTRRYVTDVSGEDVIALVETTAENADGDDLLIRYQIGHSMELDDKGQLISYEEYTPFGVPMYSSTMGEIEAPRTYRFARYMYDQESGLYQCGARKYCPWLGRWLSPDPIGTADGPNTYAYCVNDPVNRIDPGGKCSNFFTMIKNKIFPPDKPLKIKPERRSAVTQIDWTSAEGTRLLKEEIKAIKKKADGPITGYIEDNGGVKRVVLRTIAKGGLVAVNYLPFVGPVVKFAGQLGLQHEENKFQKQKRAKEDTELIQQGMDIGKAQENERWQKDLLNTLGATAEKDLAHVIGNKAMYGRDGKPAERKNNNMNYGPENDVVPAQSLRRDSVIEQAEPEGQGSLVVENLDRPSADRRPNIVSEDNTRIFNLSEASRRRPLGTREQSLFGPKQNPGNNVFKG